jgi:hypothetical protein
MVVGARVAAGSRQLSLVALVALVATFTLAASVSAAGGASWRYEPASAPPPPAGVAQAPYPVALGEVGAISFWEPNRGLLITGGTESKGGVVPPGLYAYDGVSWHQLSNVCGSATGRIAWAGPDEFWTISDQRAGQIDSPFGESIGELEALSLCHFQGDKVVGSYALPLGEADSYVKMDAAACLSASDCWFAGWDGRPPNVGSFHLHWNGSEVTVLYDSSDHSVTGMVSFGGKFYEGLDIGPGDAYLPEEEEAGHGGEPPLHPAVIRTIAPGGGTQLCTGVQSVFCGAVVLSSGRPLPVYYPEKTPPDALGGFDLATDGSPLGAGASQLWAGADPVEQAPPGSATTILHDLKGVWTQVLPGAGDATALGRARLQGSEAYRPSAGTAVGGAIAPVPGTESAWLSLNSEGSGARVALLEADGSIKATDELPEANEPVGFRGTAGPIACPAANDCWMATNPSGSTAGGWLFHLTNGVPLAPDTDPLFDGGDGVIAYRPLDSGVPPVYPDGFAEDDSLANQQPPPAPTGPPQHVAAPAVKAKKSKPLVKNVKSAFLHHRVLVISFTLTARAHVQLVARKKGRVVAETRDESLHAGSHRLSLALDPAHWPNKLQFKAKPIGASPTADGSEGSLSSGGSDTLGT